MRREALTLVFLMAAGTMQMAACDFKEEKTVVTAPPAVVVPPATDPVARADANVSAEAERKDGSTPPVQGQVDAKQAEQKRDFEQRKN